MEDIFVIDDAFTDEQKDFVEQTMLYGKFFWIFHDDVALSPEETKLVGITKKTPAISCYMKQSDPPYLFRQLYEKIEFIPRTVFPKIGKQVKEILDARSFLMFPLHEKARKEYDNIHVDMIRPHWVCLYYVNDVDGDTVLFKQTQADMKNSIEVYKNTKFEVLQRVTPKKGRVVLFNGTRYHSSTAPTEEVRCILNFDVLV